MEDSTPTQDPKEKKSWWKAVVDAVSSPMDFLSHWSNKSPLLTVLAVVFLLQPVISTSIDLIDEWRNVKQDLDPNNRPVTKGELDIVNKKVDFVQTLIVAEMDRRNQWLIQHNNQVHSASEPPSAPTESETSKLKDLQDQLANVQQKLDAEYKAHPPAKK